MKKPTKIAKVKSLACGARCGLDVAVRRRQRLAEAQQLDLDEEIVALVPGVQAREPSQGCLFAARADSTVSEDILSGHLPTSYPVFHSNHAI